MADRALRELFAIFLARSAPTVPNIETEIISIPPRSSPRVNPSATNRLQGAIGTGGGYAKYLFPLSSRRAAAPRDRALERKREQGRAVRESDYEAR